MSLESCFNQIIEPLLHNDYKTQISSQQLIHTLDLTLLDPNASTAKLIDFQEDAQKYQVAAICVFPQHLSDVNTLNKATVVNFPDGNQPVAACLEQIHEASCLGATEIDYVFPYKLYLSGNQTAALNHAQQIIHHCKTNNLLIKVILESGIFPDMPSIYKISTELVAQGCDFIKTSTGTIPQGANLASLFAITTAIKDSNLSCGVKLSGGVKTVRQALSFASLAELIMTKKIDKQWFRIGASSLLKELLDCNFAPLDLVN